MRPHYLGGEIANNCDRSAVTICFIDQQIGELFADLLTSCGVQTIISSSVEEAPKGSKVVTEPRFFERLSREQVKHCLIVGPKTSLRDIKARCLEQPLTEETVEQALAYLCLPVHLD